MPGQAPPTRRHNKCQIECEIWQSQWHIAMQTMADSDKEEEKTTFKIKSYSRMPEDMSHAVRGWRADAR